MAELDEFRAGVRAWLDENAPKSLVGLRLEPTEGAWGGRRPNWTHPDQALWLERAADRGFTAPTWPTAYGGGGLSSAEAKIVGQEIRARRLPAPLVGFGLEMIGPTLLRFGSEEQKLEHATKIARGEIRWCQGYSEPDSGSDLASLQTKAVRDGDDFIVTGQKVWTSYADVSDWIFALVRTDPDVKKQEGITFLLIDMESPGVSVHPISLISGKSPFCETRFDEVRASAKNVLGEINGGWTVAKALLGFERNMIAELFGTHASGEGRGRSTLADLARHYLPSDGGRIAEPVLRDEIAQNEMDTRVFALTVQRARDAAKAGNQPGAESSLFKVYATELNKRRTELAVRVAGPQGLGWEGPGFEAGELQRTRDWLRARGNSIEGGTSEIQLNIIAKHVLGLSG